MAGTSNSIITHNVLKGTLNSDNVISGLVNTAFNPAYALVTQAGAQIVLFINSNDYKMYAQLKDKNGNLIYTSNIIDLPLETMVVDGRYDSNTKKLILVLDNGNEIEVPLEALINGLVNEDDLIANYYDKDEIDALLNGYWTKIELTQEDIDNWNAKQEYLNQGDGIEISADTILKGNTRQESTTGKNLLNIFNFEMGAMSNGSIMSSSYRINNVNNPIEVKPNTTYCISSVLSTQVKGMRCGIHECDENMTFKKDSDWQQLATNPYVFTTENYTKYVKIVFTLSTTSTNVQTNITEDVTSYNNAVDWARGCLFQLEEGNTATSWEPYTNGPAPNPDYPYPVNVVTGDNEVKVEGKNIGRPVFDSGFYILGTGDNRKVASRVSDKCGEIIKVKPSTNYTISGTFTSFADNVLRIALFDAIPVIDSVPTDVKNTNNQLTFTTGTNTNYVLLYDLRARSVTADDLFVCETQYASTYTPYQSQTYPINLGSMELCKIGDYQDVIKRSSGKNLFDESLLTGITMNGITWSTENNKIKISGTSTSTYSQSGNTSINLQKGTYYFVKSGTTSLIYNAWLYNRDGTLIANTKLNNPFTINETATRIVLFVEGLTNGTSYNQEMNFMVSTTNGEQYEPYGKVWYKYGAIGKWKIPNNIGGYNDEDNWYYIGLGNFNNIFIQGGATLICTHYQNVDLQDYHNVNGIKELSTHIVTRNLTLSSQSEYRTFYTNNDVYFYGRLATPTITPITDTTLIEQLDNLSIGLSNKWIKNISQTNADLPFEIEYDNTNLTISASSNLVRNTDYATNSTGGVIKVGNAGTNINNNGYIYAGTLNYTQYNSADNSTFVGKGTLENVITGKELTNKTYVDAADAVFESELFDDGIISAEDVTEVSVNNTMNKSQLKINLKGNTSQESTTGKNLLSQNNSTFNIFKELTIEPINAGTYTFSGNVVSSDTDASVCLVTFRNSTTEVRAITVTRGNFSITLNLSEEVTSVRLYASSDYSKGTGDTATFSNLMISTSGGDYEPYTGGNPAPNPDYPYPVNVVTGDNEIEVVGKNLFDGVLENGTYTSTGVKEATSLLYRNKNIISVKPETTYTFSINGAKQKYVVYFYDNTQTFISWSSAFSTGTITTPSNAYYMNFRCFADDYDANFLNLKVQLEEGSTATPYEEHKEQTYPINLGSMELCKIGDYQDRFIRNSGKNLYNKAISTFDGYIINDGTETQSANYKTSDYIPIEPNTTYATGIMTNPGSNPSRCYYDENKTFISGEKHFGATTMVGTSPNNAKYMRESIPVVDIDKVQIEKGNSISSYEPYGTGQWCKYNAIGKITYTGANSENWDIENRDEFHNFKIYLSTSLGADGTITCISNYFKAVTGNQSYWGTYPNSIGIGGSKTLRIGKSDLEDVSALKTWLSTHNTEVQYVLATPYLSLIESETLQSQLDAIEKAYSYDTQTNISQTNQDKPFILDINAIADNVNGLKLENENQEYKTNKVIELSSNSTDDEYPSAKCVYDIVGNIEAVLAAMDSGSGV